MESGSDVIIKNVVFDTEEDPVVAATPIFVKVQYNIVCM